MDHRALAEYQRHQSRQIARAIIGQSEANEQRMQASWQAQWENAHKHLVALLRHLDQEYDESCEKANHPLEKMNDDDLTYLVLGRIRSLQSQTAHPGSAGVLADMQQQVQGLSHRYASLEQTNRTLEDTNRNLQEEVEALKAHLSALRQVEVSVSHPSPPDQTTTLQGVHPPIDTPEVPIWMPAWQRTRTFERTSTAICIMGETGMALRPSILRAMAHRLNLSEDNNSLDDAISRLIDGVEGGHPALIEIIQGTPSQGSSSGGNSPDVLRLTPAGLLAYQVLTGLVAVENQYDRLLRSHSSPEHTILNIQVTEFLIDAGYAVKSQAQPITLCNGSVFIPDIIAVHPDTGNVVFIEVERDVHKDQAARKQKWMNLYEASNGNLYVFCDNLACQRKVQAEINLALGDLAYNSFLTNLHGLRSGKRSNLGHGIWLSVRQASNQRRTSYSG